MAYFEFLTGVFNLKLGHTREKYTGLIITLQTVRHDSRTVGLFSELLTLDILYTDVIYRHKITHQTERL